MTPDDQMPDRLGPYRLLDRIGEGGMGVVYLARDSEHRSVAIKVLRPSVAGGPTPPRPPAPAGENMRPGRRPPVAQGVDNDATGNLPHPGPPHGPAPTPADGLRGEE